MAEKTEDVESVQETAHYSADCQAATDDDLEDLATQDHNEALSELEAACEDEFELSLHQRNGCYKKDRHKDFIPIRQFSIDNLEPPYKDQEIVEVVKLMAALTVLVRVRKISSLRPPYPYPPRKRFLKNGRPCPLNGSGFVQSAYVYREESGKPCPCSECKDSASRRMSWGQVEIFTARHVVFDGFEAEETTCYFDFDEDDTDIDSIPSLTCSKYFSATGDTTCDILDLCCYTHDVDFAEKLRNMSHKVFFYRSILRRKYYGINDIEALDLSFFLKVIDYVFSKFANKESTETNFDSLDHVVDELNTALQQFKTRFNIPQGESTTEIIHKFFENLVCGLNTHVQQKHSPLPSDLQPKGNLVIVVSHPHGCGKYVSLGEYTSRQQTRIAFDGPEFLSEDPAAFYVYTAHTCPGSSGGPVFILSKDKDKMSANRIHSQFLRRHNLSRCALSFA